MSWVCCWEAASESEAYMVRGFLEERGVPCLLRPMGSSTYPVAAFGTEVLVPADWQRVADSWLSKRRQPPRGVVAMRRPRMRA